MTLYFLALLIVLTFTAIAQTLYKLFFQTERLVYLAIAIILFLSVPPCTWFALRKLDVGFVYMSTAVIHVLVLYLSRAVLKEPVGRHHWIAVALIAGGLVLYAL